MKRSAVMVSIKGKHSNLEITRFLKVARSLSAKLEKELLNENNGDELAATSKRKYHCQRPADSLRTPEFVRRMRGVIDENPAKSMRNVLPNIFKCLKEQSVYFDKKTQENRLMRAKPLLNKLNHPEEEECLWFFSDENNFHQDEKGLRVDADEDAYVGTLQTVVCKPPWIA
ncbi:hypothetical protein ACTXT7_000781 [Hymenolepis weldensis]